MGRQNEGPIKIAAKRLGITREEYLVKINAGLKWCSGCKEWHKHTEFGRDSSRSDGLSSTCFSHRKKLYKKLYKPKKRISRKGLQLVETRDGDEKQARARVNRLVAIGSIPNPNDIKCVDCGHVWEEGERRHEYDHYKGYDVEHHTTVESVCTICHSRRDNPNATKTHCKYGHEFTEENTYRDKKGNRTCRKCARRRDRLRKRPAGYWKKVNANRKNK